MMEANKFAIPIKEFHLTNSIPLNELKTNLARFIIPQMYYYLEKETELFDYIRAKLKINDVGIIHNTEDIFDGIAQIDRFRG